MNCKSMINRSGLLLSVAFISTLLGVGVCSAASITYNVDQTFSPDSVVGTIQTDGATGVLGAGDIIGWNLKMTGPSATFTLTNFNSVVLDNGPDLTATPAHLFFNFDGVGDAFFGMVVNPGSGQQY